MPIATPIPVAFQWKSRSNAASIEPAKIVIDIGDDGVGLPPDFAEWRDAVTESFGRYKLQKSAPP